jgi:hypothetical protein
MNYLLIAALAVLLTWAFARKLQKESRKRAWWEVFLRHPERFGEYKSLLYGSVIKNYLSTYSTRTTRSLKMPTFETGRLRSGFSFDHEYPRGAALRTKQGYFAYDPTSGELRSEIRVAKSSNLWELKD